jgi:serine protease Do
MMRTLITIFAMASLASPALHAGQPGAQPAYGLNPVPETHVYASGRSYLGVDIRDITQDRLGPLKLKEEHGVEITMVDRDAPAGKAGLREHDVILDFNGTVVESEEQLRRLIRETPPGRTVTLGISREGNPMKVTVQLAEHSKVIGRSRMIEIPPIPPMPEMPDFNNRFDVPGNIYVIRNSSAVLGVQTENLTSQLGDFFGVKNGEGVLVRSVEKGSPAEKGGLKAGDVIVRIGDEKLSDRNDFSRLMRKYRTGGKLNLGIVRDKHEQTFSVELPQRSTKDSSGNLYRDQMREDLMAGLMPDIESAVESARELTQSKAFAELDRVMREQKDQFKELGKQFEKQQKELEKEHIVFEKFLHPML